MRRLVVAGVLIVVALAGPTSGGLAAADGPVIVTPNPDGTSTVDVTVGEGGSGSGSGGGTGGGGSGSPPDPCTYAPSVFDGLSGRPERESLTYEGVLYVIFTRTCPGQSPSYYWQPFYSQSQLLEQVLNRVRRELPRPLPTFLPIDTLSQFTYVHWPTLVWLDSTSNSPITITARTPGLSVTARVVPTTLVISAPEHRPVVCSATLGRPSPTVLATIAPLQPSTSSLVCEFRFQRSSFGQPGNKYQTSFTTNWDVVWTASNGDSGATPAVTTTTTVGVAVASVQVINTRR